MTANGQRQSLERELKRLAEIHEREIGRLGLVFRPEEIRMARDTWVVPVGLGDGAGTADEVVDLIRVIRRSLQAKTSDPVSVLIDPDEE